MLRTRVQAHTPRRWFKNLALLRKDRAHTKSASANANANDVDSNPSLNRSRFWKRVAAFTLTSLGILAAISWFCTADLEDLPTDPLTLTPVVETDPNPLLDSTQPAPQTIWPQQRLEGEPAKKALLDLLLLAETRLDKIQGYTASFRRQERIKGKLGPTQTLQIKVRHEPFSVYLKFLQPEAGKEIVYSEGRYDNKLIAHPGGLARALAPRLALKPDSPLALVDNRHPINEAGILNLLRRLIRFRQLDLQDPDAVTIIDQVPDDNRGGRLIPYTLHRHVIPKPERPFGLVHVWYDPDTFIPVRIQSHEWPKDGSTPKSDEDYPLAESYSYEEIEWDAPLTAIDFDPANPRYEFKRF